MKSFIVLASSSAQTLTDFLILMCSVHTGQAVWKAGVWLGSEHLFSCYQPSLNCSLNSAVFCLLFVLLTDKSAG